jgi:hypothetical protein
MNMELISNHAKKRMQQRGISKECLEQVINYGQEHYRTGAFLYLATKTVIKKMVLKGVSRTTANRCKGIYVVVQNGEIKTVAHKFKRFRRH